MSLGARTEQWRSLAFATAAQHGVPGELVLGVIWQESRGNPDAVSPAGAVGLMQLMPGTAADYGVLNRRDPASNVEGGTRYLARLIRLFGGDVAAALASYNWGEGNVQRRARWPASGWLSRVPAETASYVPSVVAAAGWTMRGELAVPPGPVPPLPPGEVPPGRTAAGVLLGGFGLGALLWKLLQG